MALSLGRWAVAALVGSTALVALAFPLSAPPTRAPRDVSPERRRANALRGELTAADQTLRRLRWTDSLAALTRGAADGEVPFVLGAPSPLPLGEGPPDAEATLAASVRSELARLGIEGPAVDLGVFLVDGQRGGEARLQLVNPARFEWYAGTSEGRPYCLAIRTTRRPTAASLVSNRWRPQGVERRTDILGPCALYARYGMPGPEIQRWMLGAGGSLATERADAPLPVDKAARSERWLFRWDDLGPADLPFQGCLVASAEACDRFVLEEHARESDPLERQEPEIRRAGVPLLDGVANPLPFSPASVASERMLHALERRFGVQAFAAFWRSDQSVPAAFTAAFGVSPAAWGRQWAESVSGDAAGARVTPGAGQWAATLLYLAVAAAAAAAVVRRRRLG